MAKTQKSDWKKKIVVLVVLSVMIGILLGTWGSTAQYTSQVDGTAEYSPALFNTVLLGDLTFAYENMPGKLGMSITVDSTTDFGALAGKEGNLQSNERRLRPGSVIAIPFTVTNGTTIRVPGADGVTPEESNLADTDIVYSLNLITTVNIPLKYDIYQYTTETQLKHMKEISASDTFNYVDYVKETANIGSQVEDANWGRKLSMDVGEITESDTIGFSREYNVRPSTYKANEGTELENKFLLQRDKTEQSIAINRYMLVVYWPDTGSNEAETKNLRDTKYMKEIDILEIRLEVESFTKNEAVNSPSYNEVGMPLLRLGMTPIGDELHYQLPEIGDVYSRHTIPFYATRELSGSSNIHYLDFVVTNQSDAMNYTYDSSTDTYHCSQIASLEDGRVAIAIPVKDTMGTVNNYAATDNFTYSISYGGKTYTGVLTDHYITTQVWEENEKAQADTRPNDYHTKNAYRIVEFKDEQGNPLMLPDFSGTTSSEVQLRLEIQVKLTGDQSAINFDNKDDFKILVYRASASEGDGNQ